MDKTRTDGTINSTMVGAAVTKAYNKETPISKGEGITAPKVHKVIRLMRLFCQKNYTPEQQLEWMNRKI